MIHQSEQQASLQVPFAGVHTFARSAFARPVNLSAGQTIVVGVPHESTGGQRSGLRWGPAGIREASSSLVYPMQVARTLIDIATGLTLTWPEHGRLLDLGDLELPLGEPRRNNDVIRRLSAEVTRQGAFLVALGGDRCVTYPLFSGVAAALRKRKKSASLIVLSDDLAFADRHPVYGQQWYGTTLRRIIASKTVDPKHVVVVGLRGTQARTQWERVRKLGLRVISLRAARALGIAATVKQALAISERKGHATYLCIDIGVVDPGHAPGRGDMAAGGFTAQELLEIIRGLAQSNICALDVVGVAPADDIGGRVQALAAQAVIEVIAPRVFRTGLTKDP